MKILEIVEIAETMIRGKTANRHIHYDPLYKGLENYDGKHLMNDADAIEALLYGRGFSQREDAFRDLLIRKYKITRETDIGALLKSIRDQLEAKNRQHVKDRDAENAKYDDEGNLVADEDISVTEQELDVMSADNNEVVLKDPKSGIETKIPRDPTKPGMIQKDPSDATGKRFVIDTGAAGEVDKGIQPGAKVVMKQQM
jgi:hypothetical protein